MRSTSISHWLAVLALLGTAIAPLAPASLPAAAAATASVRTVESQVARSVADAPASAYGRRQMVVTASAHWAYTGLMVRQGERIAITAAGSWSPDTGRPSAGPDGYRVLQSKSQDNFLNLRDIGVCSWCARTAVAHWAALIGYIGYNPPGPGSYVSRRVLPEARKVFLVGSRYRHAAPRSGPLWLNFNDDAYSDNTSDNRGWVRTTIQVGAPPAPAPRAVILIPGVLSRSGDGYFDGFQKGVKAELSKLHARAPAFIPFSYNGGSFDGKGRWHPARFACQDTFTNTIDDDVVRLDEMISGYLRTHHGGTVYLVGHSQGGLIALAYVAFLRQQLGWKLPNGGRLGGVITIDSPLGGIPDAAGLWLSSKYYRPHCPAMLLPQVPVGGLPPFRDLKQMYAIAHTIPAHVHPRGGQASVSRVLYGAKVTNQALAAEARGHGIRLLTIGNPRDYVFAPCPSVPALSSVNIDTQWLAPSDLPGTSPFARAIALGKDTCLNPLADVGANHGLALGRTTRTPAAAAQVIAGARPDLLQPPYADLAVTVTAQRLENAVGARFTIVVRNIGARPAGGVLLESRISGAGDAGTRHATGMSCAGSMVVRCRGELGIYEDAVLTLTVPGGLAGGLLRASAVVNPDGAIAELDRGNDRAVAVVASTP